MILILMASGKSERFGSNKLLYEINGVPMYQHMANIYSQLPPETFKTKILVSGYDEILDYYALQGFYVIKNIKPELGLSHTIKKALLTLNSSERKMPICFSVCDQPYLLSSSLSDFLNKWRQSGKGLGKFTYDNKGGSPSIFSPKYFDLLMSITGDKGGRDIMRKYPSDVFTYQASIPKEIIDIDTVTDIAPNKKISLRLRIGAKEFFMGKGMKDLLISIDQHKSIKKATQSLDMSYPKALKMLKTFKEETGYDAVISTKGGLNHGGSALSEKAMACLSSYCEIEKEVSDYAIKLVSEKFIV